MTSISASPTADLQAQSQVATVLPPDWFTRPTCVVSADLIGCLLCRRLPDGRVIRARITETEGYIGKGDSACHAHLGRRTARTEIMFHTGGVIYVYFTYGIHYMLNLVSYIEGEPEAVLIRAAFVESITTPTEVIDQSNLDAQDTETQALFQMKWLAGPGKLTKGLAINKTLYGLPLTPESGLWIERDQTQPPVSLRPRIGIDYAGEAKDWLLRYVWTGHPSLSKK